MKKQIKYNSQHLNTSESFIGESLEDKVRRVTQSNEPVEAISPMIYTERKDGVKAEHNIRTDKWDVAQQAMTTISNGVREKRNQRLNAKKDGMNAKTDTATTTNSEVNAQ